MQSVQEDDCMTTRDQLVEQLLDLSFEERAYFRDLLERSLEADLAIDDRDSAAWTAELDRRLAEFRSGADPGTTWPELRAELE
jgi:hypothetical protein